MREKIPDLYCLINKLYLKNQSIPMQKQHRNCVKPTWLLHLPLSVLSLSLLTSILSMINDLGLSLFKWTQLVWVTLPLHPTHNITIFFYHFWKRLNDTNTHSGNISRYIETVTTSYFTLFFFFLQNQVNISHTHLNGSPFMLFKAKIEERFMVPWRRWKAFQSHN